MSRDEITIYLKKNSENLMFYIKYSYRELGRSEEWFEEQCLLLEKDWPIIRREILLEWGNSSENSPFDEEDLEIISEFIKEPIKVVMINKYYPLNIYEEIDLTYPTLFGVDVSGGYSRDSSAVVGISSKTTKVICDFNSSVIGIRELSDFLITIIRFYYLNGVLCIERNSYGEGVIDNIRHSKYKKFLYYEYKNNKTSERIKEGYINSDARTIREYGVFTNTTSRDTMMDILKDRVSYHKDKFISPKIMDELYGLEYRKGRIDHGPTTHDDSIMALLMALYVYYYGTNLSTFGVQRFNISEDNIDVTEILSYKYNGDIIADAEFEGEIKDTILDTRPYKTTEDYYNEIIDQNIQFESMMRMGNNDFDQANTQIKLSSDFFDRLNNYDEIENDIFTN